MNTRHALKVGLLMLGAGLAGWWWREPRPPAPAVKHVTAPPTAPTHERGTAVDAAPLIAVAADGNVTLRVEQRPLEWVLEQIALQTGTPAGELLRSASAAHHPAAPAAWAAAPGGAAGDACTVAAAPAPAAEQLLGTIERGDEASRHDALLQARGAGIAVPDDTLKTLFETDASDRVRLLAFENWLESRHAEPQALRQALQSALYLPSPAIQQEARRLLAQLQDIERADAEGVQPLSP